MIVVTLAPMGKHAIVIGCGIGGFAAAAAVAKLLSCGSSSVCSTMHQIDGRTPVSDLEKLTKIYRSVLERYFV